MRYFPTVLLLTLLAACSGAPHLGQDSATNAPSPASTSTPLPVDSGENSAGNTTSLTPSPTSANKNGYTFTLVFLPGTDPRVQQALQKAAARWEQVVTSDAGPVNVNLAPQSCGNAASYSGNLTGMVVFAGNEKMDGLDGTLAKSGPCAVRTSNGLTAAAMLIFDTADLDQVSTQLDLVATHELGHALGIGSLWGKHQLLQGAGSTDPRYTGKYALREYAALGGTLQSIPIEHEGGSGTADGHWREKTFGNELMTGYLSSGDNPLSRITVGSLQDLGYAVDYRYADAYSTGENINSLALNNLKLDRHIQRPAQILTLP